MIKGVIFDYGGTIDTNGLHWAEVLWKEYQAAGLPVARCNFRDAYVHGERTMGKKPLVRPTDDFRQVLLIKSRLQLQYLNEHGALDSTLYPIEEYAQRLADGGYMYAKKTIQNSREIVEMLKRKYKLALVSNFYGNIHAILKDFGLLCSFEEVIESAVVGVRKPDPAIFTLGVKALGISPNETIVIGDSYSKDMIPAHSIGCHTIWLKGIGWEEREEDETLPDAIIDDLSNLPQTINDIENKLTYV